MGRERAAQRQERAGRGGEPKPERWSLKDWIPVIAAVVTLAGVPLGLVVNEWLQDSPEEPPAPCSFRAELVDEDPFGILGAHLGYAAKKAEITEIVRLAVADEDGLMRGQCPNESQVDYPIQLLVKRAEGSSDPCVYDAGLLLEGLANQEFFVDLQVAEPVGTWKFDDSGAVVLLARGCR